MLWKLLLDIFPFIWECFFGRKMPKDDTKDGELKKIEESHAIGFLRKLLDKIQTDKRFALVGVIILVISLLLNYHLTGRVWTLSREALERKEEDKPPIAEPMPQSAYYHNLVEHLNKTYEAGKASQ